MTTSSMGSTNSTLRSLFRRQSNRHQQKLQLVPFIVGAAKATASLFSTLNGLHTRCQLKYPHLEVAHLALSQRNIVKIAHDLVIEQPARPGSFSCTFAHFPFPPN